MDNNKKKRQEEKIFTEQVVDYLGSDAPGAVASKIILATLALGGVVCAGAVAPNILKAIDGCNRYARSGNKIKQSSCTSIITKFKRNGFIYCAEQKDGTVKVLLTEKGRKRVHDFTYKPAIKRPMLWDGKWRVIVFDVKVSKNREREVFRKELKDMGFKQIQKSVWVHPYKCEDEVLFLAKQLRIENAVEILTVQKMLHSEKWKKLFDL